MATIDVYLLRASYMQMFDNPVPGDPQSIVATVWLLDEDGTVRHRTSTINGAPRE